jgi:hypothetical protein
MSGSFGIGSVGIIETNNILVMKNYLNEKEILNFKNKIIQEFIKN